MLRKYKRSLFWIGFLCATCTSYISTCNGYQFDLWVLFFFRLTSFKRNSFAWTLSQYQALNRNANADEIHSLLDDLVS